MDKVILKLLNKDSYVFGGYVRDSIINNEKYNDIDILIMESKENFEKKLKQNFRVYIKDEIGSLVKYILYDKDNNEIYIDAVYEEQFIDSPNLDVNCLIFKNNVIKLRHDMINSNISIESIKNNIKNKKFEVLYDYWYDDCDCNLMQSISKMKKRKWICTNERYL